MPESDRGTTRIDRSRNGPASPATTVRTTGTPRRPGAQPSPVTRARGRRRPALEQPPEPTRIPGPDELLAMEISVSGTRYLVGPALTGEVRIDEALDEAATVTLTVHDEHRDLLNILADEDERLAADAIRLELAGVRYALADVDVQAGDEVTLIFEDEVAWRLRQFRRTRSWSRARYTRAEVVQWMVDEASGGAHAPLRSFIPELVDRQRTLRPEPLDA